MNPISVLIARAVALAMCCATAFAQGLPAVVRTIEGRSLSGSVTLADGKLEVRAADGGITTLPLDEAATIRADAGSRDKAKAAPYAVWFRSGSFLPAVRIDGIGAGPGGPPAIRVESASGLSVEVPLSAVAAFRSRANDPQTFHADRAQPDDNRDYLYVVKAGEPQRFTVHVEAIVSGALRFDLRGSAYEFPVHGEDSVAAVVFGKNTGASPDPCCRPRCTVSLVGGETLRGGLLALAAEASVQLDEGPVLRLPSDALLGIDVVSDRLRVLSDLEPGVEQTPAFDRVRPWTRDRSPAGDGIRLAGVVYDRGFVLPPRTRLTFALDGSYDRFEAMVGFDERSGPLCDAVFRVFADGKVVFDAAMAGAKSAPVPVRLDIAGCKELALEADFGQHFDLGDLCAFADARVLRTAEVKGR